MTKKVVVFQARITYEVDAKSPLTAGKKAYEELTEMLPCTGDESDDGKVTCVDLQLDQVFPMYNDTNTRTCDMME